MNTFFSIVASNTAFAAMLAVAAVALTKLRRDPHLAHALWLLVLLKLITPPLVLVPWLSAFSSGDSSTKSEAKHAPSLALDVDSRVVSPSIKNPGGEPVSGSADPVFVGEGVAYDANSLLLIAWIVGSTSYVLITVTRCLRFSRVLKVSVEAPDELAAASLRLADEIGLRQPPAVRIADACIPPLVWCLGWKPLVLLPARLFDRLEPTQQQTVMVHELAHIRRRDHLLRWLEVGILALFWWYPVAWWASRRMRQAEDECCDAWVVSMFPDHRRSYGQALLRTVEYLTESDLSIPRLARCVSSGSLLKRRIEVIMNQEPNRRMTRATLALAVSIGIVVLPTAADDDAVAKRQTEAEQNREETISEKSQGGANSAVLNLEEDVRPHGAFADQIIEDADGSIRAIGEARPESREHPNRTITDAVLRKRLNEADAALTELDLSYSSITDVGLSYLKDEKSLTTLSLTSTAITDEGLKHLQGLPELKKLYLSGTKVTDQGLPHLRPLRSLETLLLGGTRITDEGMRHIGGLTELRELHLWGTALSDDGLAELVSLQQLEVLILNGTRITDRSLNHLEKIKSLRRVSMKGGGVRVTEGGVRRLEQTLGDAMILSNSTTILSRPAWQGMQTVNNLKQIMLAMHKYHDTSKAFPAAYSADNEGMPLLSWRVHILPFIEQGALYEQFRLDEPWDSEHNRKFIRQMPAVYRAPGSNSEPGKTNYLGNAAEDGIVLPPAKDQQNPPLRMPVGSAIKDVDDGVSNTIGIVEVRDELAVIWTKPDDFQSPKGEPARGLIGLHKGGFWAAFCDGSARFVPEGLERMEVLFTRAGGEFAPNF